MLSGTLGSLYNPFSLVQIFTHGAVKLARLMTEPRRAHGVSQRQASGTKFQIRHYISNGHLEHTGRYRN